MSEKAEERPLSIGCAVRFVHKGETIHGHLLERQRRRRRAKVIDAEDRTWRVPEAMLAATGKARRVTMVASADKARAAWRKGDEAAFESLDGPMRGVVVKLNPKTAKVRCGDVVWVVSYGALRATGGKGARNGAERLNAVAGMAQGLMERHGLSDWTLAFVESGRRLGDCSFRDKVIRIARGHALDHSDEQIRDTVLHEIAHALAGPEAGHGPVWKAAARRIGATPRARAYESDMG